MFLCLYCHISQFYGYINDEAMQLHQKAPDIVSQKMPLFGAYAKFGCSLC